MHEITSKNNFPREREKINFKVQWLCGNTGKIPSSVSFHQNFQVFHTKFNIRFRCLVLLEMNCFEKIFKRALQTFAIQSYKILVLSFYPLVTQIPADSVRVMQCFELRVFSSSVLCFQDYRRMQRRVSI